MKIKCPYFQINKHCTYKNENNSKYKTQCIYSNVQKCPFFKEWADKLNNYEKKDKIEHEALDSPQTTYKHRIRKLINKWEK